jgi:hypothetical protein
LRGETMREIAEDRIREWSRNLSGLPCAEVRVCHSVEDMWLGSCMGIDRRLVRLDVYDPEVQRSLEGVMVELESPQGLRLNLVRVFVEAFDQAWRRAAPIPRMARALWWWRRGWKAWTGLLFVALALVPVSIPGQQELFMGIASGLLATALVESGAMLRRRRRRR